MKKETLEEAAESYVKDSSHELYQLRKQCFMDGAKWQAERSYSEEEVLRLIIKFNQEIREVDDVKGWFEQFKKKQYDNRKMAVKCYL